MNNNCNIENNPTVTVIGSGNVASHLIKAFTGKCKIYPVNPHTFEGMPTKTDIALISVKDDAIIEVSQKIEAKADIVAHTSGTVSASVLSKAASHYGVFYPLQTFSKNVELDYSEIPLFIEGNCQYATERLKSLGRMFSKNVIEADSLKRKQLHLASVFACNFTNRMAGIAAEILKEAGIDFRTLQPLMRQTIAKLDILTPDEAQTGPAAREDSQIINAHIAMLQKNPRLQRIYRDITDEIISTHNQKKTKQ